MICNAKLTEQHAEDVCIGRGTPDLSIPALIIAVALDGVGVEPELLGALVDVVHVHVLLALGHGQEAEQT